MWDSSTKNWTWHNIVRQIKINGQFKTANDQGIVDLGDVVHLSGTETITGQKTFREVVKGVKPDDAAVGDEIVTASWVRSVLQAQNSEVVHVYVASNGNDVAYDGRTSAKPKKTIQSAMEVLNKYRLTSPTGLEITLEFNSGNYDLKTTGSGYAPIIAHTDAVNQNGLVITGAAIQHSSSGKPQLGTKITSSQDLNDYSWYLFLQPIASNLIVRNIRICGYQQKDQVTGTTICCLNAPSSILKLKNVEITGGNQVFNISTPPGRVQIDGYLALSGMSWGLGSSSMVVYPFSNNSHISLSDDIDSMSADRRGKLVFKNISITSSPFGWNRGGLGTGCKWRLDIILDNVTGLLSNTKPGSKQSANGTDGSEYHAYIYCKNTDITQVLPGVPTNGDAYNHVIQVTNDSQFPSWYDPNWDAN